MNAHQNYSIERLWNGTKQNGLTVPSVKVVLDEMCEAAKQEMRDMKESELGSWQNAVTVADGMWKTRGWHSKNSTFTIRNYLNGALLYYHHLCQKGRDEVIEEELYRGTSKSSEGFAARVTFQNAIEEGMHVAVHYARCGLLFGQGGQENLPFPIVGTNSRCVPYLSLYIVSKNDTPTFSWL